MRTGDIISLLELLAPPALQESYDNAGLITGDRNVACTGILCALDATENIIGEAVEKGCNLVVAHHPIVFGGLKKLSGDSYVERAVVKAIKHDISIYAIHTNLDNVHNGVNKMMADKLGLQQPRILAPKAGTICKLYTYVPAQHADELKNALFAAGAGNIGLYEECSFSTTGNGSFKPKPGSNPVIGQAGGEREHVAEVKIELIFPAYLQGKLVAALKKRTSL